MAAGKTELVRNFAKQGFEDVASQALQFIIVIEELRGIKWR